MNLPRMSFDREMLSRFEEAIQKEWLITNGLGGYASSTALGVNTRKYHALLVAALHPPRDRRVFLSKLDEDVHVGKDVFRLGTNEFQDGFYPHGYDFLKEFSVSPLPKYVYSMPDVELQKTIFMPYKRNAVITLYSVTNNSNSDVAVQVFPIVNNRNYHAVTDRLRTPMQFAQRQEGAKVELGLKPLRGVLTMMATEGRYSENGKWVEKLYLREEASRGETCLDDCYQPGHFETSVDAGENRNLAVAAVASEDEDSARKVFAQLPSSTDELKALCERETRRYEKLLTDFHGAHGTISPDVWLNWLVLAADSFLVQGQNDRQTAVIAGYHWFEAWGRDTFVSLPGLTLVTGKFDCARRIFQSFSNHCKQGLIPNFLSEETEQPAYNTVDATLWFVNSTMQYLKHTGDFEFVRERLWDTLKSIIENHVKGTGFSIRVDTDGLLSHGPRLTWMDAAVDGYAVTARTGEAVEIQALWYNALKIMHLLAKKFDETVEAERYLEMAGKARKSFAEKFWNNEKNCLYDCVNQYEHDGSLRPNQIFAVSMDFSMLDAARQKRVVEVVERELLTPYGLRTLSKNDSRYRGYCAGDRRSRDAAYHNGTVWPWLLGPFTTAFLRTERFAPPAREYALKRFLMPLFTQKISDVGLGTLSEIYDGDPPHTSRGCIAQAWSVAEPLRAYVEDIRCERPKYENDVLRVLG